jgi:hypothetical protein
MDTPAETPAQISARRQYQWTLILFALVAAATVIWFKRHIESYVTETLIVGGTISLWGLWKLLWSGYEDAGGDGQKTLTRRLLGNPAATRALYFAALIIAFLHFTTSSIYLSVAGAAPGEGDFKVQVIENGEVVMGPFEMSPGETIGNPIVPGFRTRKLTYQIVQPNNFLMLDKELPPWGAHDLSVPGSFKRKVLHIVALVPDKVLYSVLPKKSEPGGERYYLEIASGGKMTLLEDYLQALVLTGAGVKDLPSSSTATHDERIREEIADHFAHAGLERPEETVSTLLSADIQQLGSAEFAADAPLQVTVGTWLEEGGARKKVPSLTCQFVVPPDRGLHTLVVGVTQKGTCK